MQGTQRVAIVYAKCLVGDGEAGRHPYNLGHPSNYKSLRRGNMAASALMAFFSATTTTGTSTSTGDDDDDSIDDGVAPTAPSSPCRGNKAFQLWEGNTVANISDFT